MNVRVKASRRAVVQPLCQAYVVTYNEHPVELRPSGKDLYYIITCADKMKIWSKLGAIYCRVNLWRRSAYILHACKCHIQHDFEMKVIRCYRGLEPATMVFFFWCLTMSVMILVKFLIELQRRNSWKCTILSLRLGPRSYCVDITCRFLDGWVT